MGSNQILVDGIEMGYGSTKDKTVPYGMGKGNDAIHLEEQHTRDIDNPTHCQFKYPIKVSLKNKNKNIFPPTVNSNIPSRLV